MNKPLTLNTFFLIQMLGSLIVLSGVALYIGNSTTIATEDVSAVAYVPYFMHVIFTSLLAIIYVVITLTLQFMRKRNEEI